jgi:Skp family chaperone for outer membrane proteins
MGHLGTWVSADQRSPATKSLPLSDLKIGAANKVTTKVGVINISQVIKDFARANAIGQEILDTAKDYEKELKAVKEQLDADEAATGKMPEGEEKDAASKRLREGQNALKEKDVEYQKTIRRRRDDMAIEVNKAIQHTTEKIARQRGFDLVLTCPHVATKEEIGSLTDAMRRMTASAVWVAWNHPDLDLTDDVIGALNRDFPPPKNP